MRLFGKRSRENEAETNISDSSTDQPASDINDSDLPSDADATMLVNGSAGLDDTADIEAASSGYHGAHSKSNSDASDDDASDDTATFSEQWESLPAVADVTTVANPLTTAVIPSVGDTADSQSGYSDGNDATAMYRPVTSGMATQLADSANMPGAKKPFNKKRLFIILGIVLGVIVVAYFGASIFFVSHFGFNTTIGDVDASFKTVSQVEQLLSDEASSYKLTVSEREDKTEYIEGSAIDFKYSGDTGQVQTILSSQNPFLFFTRIWNNDEEPIAVDFSYNADKLTAAVSSLACVTNPTPIAPTDAYPEFDGTKYVVHAEEQGTTIDQAKLQETIAAKVKNGVSAVNISDEGCYVAPTVTSDSPDLVDRINLLDKYTPFALTYTFSDGSTEQLDGETIFDWLTIADDGTYTVDDDALRAWVSDFASRHTTVGKKRTFTSVDGNTYSVEGGSYGWSVDEDAEVDSIYNMLETKQSETREPYWATTAATNATGETPDWGNTYIDLNLTTQHMYYVKDGVSIFDCDVVTGKPTNGHNTPEGVYYILEKMRNKTLTGELTTAGIPEYETPVAYWMRVTWTGVGFHDATWQSSFGGDRYLTHGSHGCINMSLSDAAELYSICSTGDPIVSHY